MEYKFYGWQVDGIHPLNNEYPGIETPRDLYDAMSIIWCEYSCAPRFRPEWNEDNKSLGQCSITAFLAQDIFGGKVCGIPRPDGTVHCYNVVDGKVFDVASEQFGDEVLTYNMDNDQNREDHFTVKEKFERYKYLCDKLHEYCEKNK